MKKIISLLLTIVILASITTSLDFTAKAADLPSSGWCSTTAKFTFNKKNGLLTISGKGAINRQVFYGKSQIKKVVVKKGITQIGQREFKNCINLNTLELPNGLTFIGKEAFSNTAYYKNRSNWKNNTLYYKKYLLKANDEHFEKIHNNAIYSKNCIYRYTVKKGTVLIAERAIPVYKNTSCSHLHITLPSSLKFICSSIDADTVFYEGTNKSFKKIRLWYPSKKKNSANKNFGYRKVKYNISYPPAAVSIKYAKNAFTIKWKYQSKAKGYQVQYATKKNMSGAKTKTVKGGKKTSLTVKKLNAKKTYYVRMRSYRTISGKNIYGAWTSIIITPQPAAPSKPSRVFASSIMTTSFVLNWSKVSCSGYQIMYSTNAGMSSATTKIITDGNKTSFTISYLIADKAYYVRVRAYKTANNKKIYGQWTKSIKVETSRENYNRPVAPSTPARLWTDNITNNSITLHWSGVDCTGYEVQYSDNGQTFSSLKESTNATEIEVEGLTPNTTYMFRIRAYNENKGGKSVSKWAITSAKTNANNDKRKITFHVTLPVMNNIEDKLIIEVDGDKYEKEVNLDGSTVTIKTDEKYKGAVKFKGRLVKTKSSFIGETDKGVYSFSLSGGGIVVLAGEDDL